ncbi:MAG: ferrous iron transport protein B [Planctomycetaceae bacterium]|nr:ferrous iron transport protein B [Planctomycetaceae bacterium]
MDSKSVPESVTSSGSSVVLVGNPNTGKSTLFNLLTGQRQLVANYPGVTVAKKSGEFTVQGDSWNVIDLPGAYSLVPRSPDEKITSDILHGRYPGESFDIVVSVVDASNLRRNLFLVSQVLELRRPTLIALTKLDILAGSGDAIDVELLRDRIGVPIIELDPPRKQGIEALLRELGNLREQVAAGKWRPAQSIPNQSGSHAIPNSNNEPTEASAAEVRYAAIDRHWMPALSQASALVAPPTSLPSKQPSLANWKDRVDSWLTHGISGSLFFLLIMFGLFYAVFYVAGPAGDLVDAGLGAADNAVSTWLPDGMFRDLLVDGIIGGVGNFLVFLPQIFVLFLFIGLLESTGYMARAAFLMDRVFSPIGLSGKSFVPLLSSFACAIPGIMATRIIERPRDRILTIMIAPLMSCSARLPVYSIMISAIVTSETWLRALVLLAMYLIGVVVAIGIVVIWKKFIWREPSPEFLLELPELQFPHVSDVLRRTCERSGEFVVRAGTIILALTILIWAANYFPRHDQLVSQQLAEAEQLQAELEVLPAEADDVQTGKIAERLQRLELEVQSIRQEHSYLGQAGKWIEPVVRPLGWDWRIGCAALASFPAREVIVTTLGILYQVVEPEDNQDDLEAALRQAKWPGTEQRIFTIPVALSIMVFFALCSQCASTLAVIYQETRSIWWPLLSFLYMTTLAYVGAFLTYQIGSWIAG